MFQWRLWFKQARRRNIRWLCESSIRRPHWKQQTSWKRLIRAVVTADGSCPDPLKPCTVHHDTVNQPPTTGLDSLCRNKPSGCPLNCINPLNNTTIHSNLSTMLKKKKDFDIFPFYYPMIAITLVALSASSHWLDRCRQKQKTNKNNRRVKSQCSACSEVLTFVAAGKLVLCLYLNLNSLSDLYLLNAEQQPISRFQTLHLEIQALLVFVIGSLPSTLTFKTHSKGISSRHRHFINACHTFIFFLQLTGAANIALQMGEGLKQNKNQQPAVSFCLNSGEKAITSCHKLNLHQLLHHVEKTAGAGRVCVCVSVCVLRACWVTAHTNTSCFHIMPGCKLL